MMADRKVYRDARTGEYVTEDYAAEAIDDLVRAGMTLPRAMGSARAALLLAAAANTDTDQGDA